MTGVSVTGAAATPDGNEAPLAEAGLDQTVTVNATVYLDASGSRDPDGSIASYEWQIERPDGSTTTPECRDCARTTFSARQNGTYNATITVTDDDGATSTDTLRVHVERVDGPKIDLTGPDKVRVGTTAEYTASTEAGEMELAAVTWREDGDWLNKTDISGEQVTLDRTHSFDSTGEYTIEATVVDKLGHQQTDEITVTVVEPEPPSDDPPSDPPDDGSNETEPPGDGGAENTTGPQIVLTGLGSVQVDRSTEYTSLVRAGDADLGNVTWRLDGTKLNVAEVSGDKAEVDWSHTFDSTGKYTLEATVVDKRGRQRSDSLTITVLDPEQQDGPAIVLTGPGRVEVGTTAEYTALARAGDASLDGVGWRFDGDWLGSTNVVGQNARVDRTRTFDSPGNYTVRAAVVDEFGNQQTDAITVTVYEPEPPEDDGPELSQADGGGVSCSTYGRNDRTFCNHDRMTVDGEIVISDADNDGTVQWKGITIDKDFAQRHEGVTYDSTDDVVRFEDQEAYNQSTGYRSANPNPEEEEVNGFSDTEENTNYEQTGGQSGEDNSETNQSTNSRSGTGTEQTNTRSARVPPTGDVGGF